MGIMSFGDNREVVIEGIGLWMMMSMMTTGQVQGIGIIGILVLDGTMMIMNLEGIFLQFFNLSFFSHFTFISGVIGRITKIQVLEDTNAITDKHTTLNSRTTPDPDRTDTKATEMTKIKKCPIFLHNVHNKIHALSRDKIDNCICQTAKGYVIQTKFVQV